MHTIIVGAGAVGGYFGGRIAEAGFPVTFLVREGRFKQLQERGLRVSSYHGDFTIAPKLAISHEEIENPKLVLVALKNYHLEAALPQLDGLVKNGAKILPLLNGVEHIDILKERFGEVNILGGVCYIESTLNEDGDVIHTSPMHDIVFGGLTSGNQEFLSQVEDMFRQSKVNVIQAENIMTEMWNKFIFLTTLSGITSATRQPVGIVREDAFTRKLLENLIQEIYQMAISQEATLSEDTVTSIIHKIEGLPAGMTSSMHRDLEKGYPIELDSLQGYILQLAKRQGKDVPVISAIYSLLHPYINGKPQN